MTQTHQTETHETPKVAMMLGIGGIRVGDGFVGFGPGYTITEVRYAGQTDIGGSVERQRYAVTVSNGADERTITYAGDSRVHVLRAQS